MKIEKILYISLVMLFLVSPIVVSSPPKTKMDTPEETLGNDQVTEQLVPDTVVFPKGFHYNPSYLIHISPSEVVAYSSADVPLGDWDYMEDRKYFGRDYTPREYGPNVFTETRMLQTSAEASSPGFYAYAEMLSSYSYSITANRNVILFSASSITSGSATASGSLTSSSSVAGYGDAFLWDFQVDIPFAIGAKGVLVIQQSDLRLLSTAVEQGSSGGYYHSASGEWWLNGPSCYLDSDHMEVYHGYPPYGGDYVYKDYARWIPDQGSIIPVAPGDYTFHATVDRQVGDGACAPYEGAAGIQSSCIDYFTVRIIFIPH